MYKLAYKRVIMAVFLFSFSFIFGCTGFENIPEESGNTDSAESTENTQDRSKKGFIPTILLELEEAIEEARANCKDLECYKELEEIKKMRDLAYEMYWECRDCEWIKVAMEALDRAKKLCPPEPKPTPPPADPRVIDRMTLRINFDFDRAEIRESERGKLQKGIDFINKYPDSKIVLEGHTCTIGTEGYNQGLSERRARSVRIYMIKEGEIAESRITSKGYGELRPAESNETEQGRILNRRVEILILSDED